VTDDDSEITSSGEYVSGERKKGSKKKKKKIETRS